MGLLGHTSHKSQKSYKSYSCMLVRDFPEESFISASLKP
jgi:hypothetical protein